MLLEILNLKMNMNTYIKIVQDCLVKNTSQIIKVKFIGAIDTDDIRSHGLHIHRISFNRIIPLMDK